MLDKSKIYVGYSGSGVPYKGQTPQPRFKRVRILFEDGISFYAAYLIDTDKDSRGYGRRYSVKKHCFFLKEIAPEPDKIHISHSTCPICLGAMIFTACVKEIPQEPKVPSHNICPFCAVVTPVVICMHRPTDTELFQLIMGSNLVIQDGKIRKNRFGPTGVPAGVIAYDNADLIIEGGQVVRNRVTRR